ncbi:bifunctional (p)ppGpp synthetase/guanosine-3',5'-bis(diphosphate) 3'-pyrophosphohydrolase [Psychroserpens burtonensis]|uniref:Bifunctional (P)ppGpp synthetase/guanosine-3',5'-bis(Diphosphate) 3'-pyrophosphohydrolase n=1 Tax=Psychroserpens burtonensis TaxID=49278 RepID=A0A5C7B5I1_9FLAO|nr:RelA/SpoT family protein [Psychroserpens burtonensis]TXE16390.1 bifunctional (p)ppGpp synthetase/guanosine-3',5'-bis(diphosphate) 3'-pyrophosphohydrolase [Psychroserpens burtonensis]
MTEEAIEKENAEIAKAYKNLLKVSYQTLTKEDKKLIRQAFEVALDAHKDQRRKSGEAYIFHPIAVARIVASEIGLDATSIAAALLHDVVEDSADYTKNDIARLFGETVARIVDGLTKISSLSKETDVSTQAENFRKMLLTLNDDVRVIIIKIADRLHNMQTMDSMRLDKQEKIASETLYIYAPLAHRIGLYNIKTELEDLGMKYTEPEVYNDILEKMQESKKEQDEYIKAFSKVIVDSLDKEGLNYDIKGRPKSIYSIRKKIVKQGVDFDEVYDKFAVRIIYKSDIKNEKFLAWKIYSIVTDHFTPNPTRLRDWISSPKSTGYEALHITVMGPKNRWVEVQVRSERMNEIAEKGYAAHYKYKEGNTEDALDTWINKLQEALESNETNAVDFVEQFKLNLYSKEIFVFSPKGDIKSLPKGATPLDFAFSVHTQVGMKTKGAKVNGRLVPLSHVLNSGDQVEILTSETIKPNRNWLDYATTARALSKIKSALKADKKDAAEEGKEILRRKLKQLKIALDEKSVNEMVTHFKLKTSLDLFYRVGIGTIDNPMLKDYASSKSNMFMNYIKNKIRKPSVAPDLDKDEITSKYDQLVFGKEEEKLDYKLSTCCNPIPGDPVFGFLTINDGIKVHKKNCPNALSMQSNYEYRVMIAKWIDSSQEVFATQIKLSGIDDLGLVNNITQVISSNMHVDMKSISFESNDGIFTGKINVVVPNITILKKLIDNLKKINGIDKVNRI